MNMLPRFIHTLVVLSGCSFVSLPIVLLLDSDAFAANKGADSLCMLSGATENSLNPSGEQGAPDGMPNPGSPDGGTRGAGTRWSK